MNMFLHILIGLFFFSLLGGQLFRIPLYPGITIYPHDMFLFGLVCFELITQWKTLQTYRFALRNPLLMFIGALFVSFIVAAGPHALPEQIEAFAYLVRFILYASVYFLVAATNRKHIFLYGLYGLGVGVGVLGLIQFAWYPNLRNLSYLGWDPHYYRLFSTFLDPNFTGLFLLLSFILGMYYIQQKKLMIFFSQIILFISLILTLSRSTYVAFIGSIILYAFFRRSWKVLLTIFLFIGILFWAPIPQRERTPILRQESSLARVSNWTESIARIRQAPVLGYGFNFSASQLVEIPDSQTVRSHALAGVDNSFLFVLATSGIVGGGTFLFLIWSMTTLGLSTMNRKKSRMLGELYFLSLAAICIHSLFVNSFFYPWILLWVWTFTGIIDSKKT